jgi:hypothetical protein
VGIGELLGCFWMRRYSRCVWIRWEFFRWSLELRDRPGVGVRETSLTFSGCRAYAEKRTPRMKIHYHSEADKSPSIQVSRCAIEVRTTGVEPGHFGEVRIGSSIVARIAMRIATTLD